MRNNDHTQGVWCAYMQSFKTGFIGPNGDFEQKKRNFRDIITLNRMHYIDEHTDTYTNTNIHGMEQPLLKPPDTYP